MMYQMIHAIIENVTADNMLSADNMMLSDNMFQLM
jgi:hypothetical protein